MNSDLISNNQEISIEVLEKVLNLIMKQCNFAVMEIPGNLSLIHKLVDNIFSSNPTKTLPAEKLTVAQIHDWILEFMSKNPACAIIDTNNELALYYEKSVSNSNEDLFISNLENTIQTYENMLAQEKIRNSDSSHTEKLLNICKEQLKSYKKTQ